MRASKIVSTIVLASIFSLNGVVTFAAEDTKPLGAKSKTHISFTASEEPTGPVDPTDPNKPVDPDQPIDPTDPENPGTGNEGALAIDYVSNIVFGEKEIESGDTIYNAMNENPFVQVTDKRGTGAGWTLSAQTNGFKTEAGKQLKGAELSFKNGHVKTRTDNVSTAPIGNDVVFSNADAKVIMSAKKDAGRGTWLDVFSGEADNNENVQLKVLEGSADANIEYSAEINWTLANAPK
ncbi:cell surface protein [Enterococcus silesiacus]|uniref:Cell surface protein n=1 Tax=Enterococcus silesiacus TaxID=332949 RepID=A0A0S3KET9_9ENTE|nr:WxL domain-containing protein [Enterococcus silesiacus]ALS02797.1 cell surface protein [Enterococcus silesiacus]OJG87230.1 hypothetical protein RV15_GL001994 [Enterococcus silesiacus]